MIRARKASLAGLAGLVSLVLAAPLVAPSASAVVGTPDDAGNNFVARLDVGDGQRSCTGALVAPLWVLTAASCFVEEPAAGLDLPIGPPDLATTATIGRADLTTDAGVVRDVVELVPHESRDLVMVQLSGAATGVAPVSVATTAPSVGEQLQVSGYGRTATEWSPLRRHAGTFTVDSVTGGDIAITGQNGAAVCAGDTGGPTLRTTGGDVELVAVNSRSWQGGCFGADPAETRTGAVNTRVDDIHDWIEVTSLNASIVTVAHPGDEFQAWSLIDGSSANYKIFVVATRGEQSNACTPEKFAALQQTNLGEVAPSPTPTGKWTTSCADARMNSMLGYLSAMSEHDPTVPGSWSAPRDIGPFPAVGVSLCRDDGGAQVCGNAQRSARVWLDEEGRGAVVSWDLGDGDLTEAEVQWALRTTLAERSALGLPHQRVHNVLGGYANNFFDCYVHPHADTRAVNQTLLRQYFGAAYNTAATCAGDPNADRAATVSTGSLNASFSVAANGQRLGAHSRHYGWLYSSYAAWDAVGQEELFHSHQSFWTRREADLTG